MFFEVPEISESSVLLLKADENITLECNVSFFEQVLGVELVYKFDNKSTETVSRPLKCHSNFLGVIYIHQRVQ